MEPKAQQPIGTLAVRRREASLAREVLSAANMSTAITSVELGMNLSRECCLCAVDVAAKYLTSSKFLVIIFSVCKFVQSRITVGAYEAFRIAMTNLISLLIICWWKFYLWSKAQI